MKPARLIYAKLKNVKGKIAKLKKLARKNGIQMLLNEALIWGTCTGLAMILKLKSKSKRFFRNNGLKMQYWINKIQLYDRQSFLRSCMGERAPYIVYSDYSLQVYSRNHFCGNVVNFCVQTVPNWNHSNNKKMFPSVDSTVLMINFQSVTTCICTCDHVFLHC